MKARHLLLAALVCLAVSLLWYFNERASRPVVDDYCPGDPCSGFSKIRPQIHTIHMSSDGTFKCVLRNAAGTNVNLILEETKINTTFHPEGQCREVSLNQTEVSDGGFVQLSASGCPYGTRGEAYELSLVIPYTITISGVTRKHRDGGFIRGPYE